MTDMKVGDKGRIWCDNDSILEDKSSSSTLEIVTIIFIEDRNCLVLVPRNLGWLAKNNYNETSIKQYGIDPEKRYWWISKQCILPLKQKCNLCV